MKLKQFTLVLTLLVLCLLGINKANAQSFDIAIIDVTLDCSSAPAQLSFTIAATSDAGYLVDNWNLWLNFNDAALTNPQITFDSGFTGTYGTGIDEQTNYVQFNSFWNGAANAQTESFDAIPNAMATITFDVLNENEPSGLNFDISQTFGSDNSFNEYYLSDGNVFGAVSLTCAGPACSIDGIAVGIQSACSPNTNTYTQSLTITYSNPPATGQLVVNGQNFALTGSPQSVILTNLPANGVLVSVTAAFSDDAGCALVVADFFTAPASCLPTCEISAIELGPQTDCDPLTNTYTQKLTITYSIPPAGGQLSVNDQLFDVTGSPQTVTLENLDANGASVDVSAFFTDNPACALGVADLFTAPANCTPVCNIIGIAAGNQTDCNPLTNAYSQEVIVTYENAPATGQLVVNGLDFAITGSPQTVVLDNLVSDGSDVTVSVSFSDNPACSRTIPALFTAPANCTPVCNINGITAGAQTDCDPLTNTYTQEITVEYDNAPATGQLVVNGQGFDITGSPQTIVLEGLLSDGAEVNVSIAFTDDATCVRNVSGLFTAPQSCEIVLPCLISDIAAGAQTECNPITNTYTQEIIVTYENAPAGSLLWVNGQTFAITGSPQTVVLEGLASDGNAVSVDVTFTDNQGCNATIANLFVAPVSCVLPDPCEGVTIEPLISYNCFSGLGLGAIGGAEPYIYTIEGEPVEDGLFFLNGGYVIEVTDNNGCSAEAFLVVNALSDIVIEYSCETGLSVTAFEGVAPYTLLANSEPVNNGDILADGFYLIEVVDAAGCSLSGAINITCEACGNYVPNAGIMPTGLQAVCAGGAASLLSDGIETGVDVLAFYVVHTSPDIFDGEFAGVFAVPADPTEAIAITTADLQDGVNNTTYYVTAVVGINDNDADGLPDLNDACTGISDSMPLVFLDELVVSIEPICNVPEQQYTLIIAASGSYPTYDSFASYTLNGTDEFTSTIETAPFPNNTAYFVSVTDNAGCSVEASTIIACGPTPVSLVRFDGTVLPNGNLLNWVTASETNNNYFTLSRSTDGINFQPVGTVKGAGTASTSRSYELLDTNAPAGVSYYQLEQTDFDGTTSLVSGVIMLRRSEVNAGFVSVMPVPASKMVNITFSSEVSGAATFKVADVAGREIDSQVVQTHAGLNTATLDIANYAPGVYFVTLNNGVSVHTTRLVKE
ncbi:MAG TPA: T9SS type A sorting domain-containing protein [Chitinophagales bacterium]|nr:T9SS type A sorting domain-containing protein [Chitinophagales bacterium]HRK28735.1 T9SS type A sorting domain-containing protein [Chitinophagales bacterium]